MSDASAINPIVLYKLQCYDPGLFALGGGGVRTIYLSDRADFVNANAISTGLYTIPINTRHESGLSSRGVLSIDLVAAWGRGIAQLGLGEISLVNTAGARDAWATYSFDGFPIQIALGVVDASGNLSVTPLFTGVMEQPDIGLRSITIPVRSTLYSADKPVITTVFAGTGSTEGDATVAGKAKPKVFGHVYNFPAIPLDSATLLYYVSQNTVDLSASTVTAGRAGVYDRGLLLSGYTYYTTVALLLAATVAAGDVAWTNGAGGGPTGVYIRLGQAPTGEVTVQGGSLTALGNFDVTLTALLSASGVSVAANLGDCFYGIRVAGVEPATPTNYPNLNIGVYVNDLTTTFAEVFAQISSSLAGWMWVGENGITGAVNGPVFWTGQFPAKPFGASQSAPYVGVTAALINPSDIVSMTRVGNPKNPGEGAPPFQVQVNAIHNETVQVTDIASTVTVAERSKRAQEWISRQAIDTSIRTQFPLAQSILFEGKGLTTFDRADPGQGLQDIPDRLLSTLSHNPQWFRVTVKLTPALWTPVAFLLYSHVPSDTFLQWTPAVQPSVRGACLGLRYNRLGFTTTGYGYQFFPMSVSCDLDKKQVTYLGWTLFQTA